MLFIICCLAAIDKCLYPSSSDRIPKQVFFGELSEIKRARGRPKLRFKDLYKASMTDFKIKPDLWLEMASNQDIWRAAMRKGEAEYEKALITKMEDKRHRKKNAHFASTRSALFLL
jgi:hypothetical protein